ncbi:MAG: AAA family ATPase [Emergencia sp.]
MNSKINAVLEEIRKVIIGKDEKIARVLMALLAEGHVLIEDVPGVGKTTLALAFSRALGLEYNRTQFTPDVVPSDIVGFSMYNRETGQFEYRKGAVFANLFLADEINRTSSKTQSALLEVMEERQATVDGVSHAMPRPFMVIATQNPAGSAGTQFLPGAQLDRFLIRLEMGYPDFQSQVEILRGRQKENPLEHVQKVLSAEDILQMQKEIQNIHTAEEILQYITALAAATREHPMVALGVSPRGAISVLKMARARAYTEGRDYIIPEDVADIFIDVCGHRIVLNARARVSDRTAADVLAEILEKTEAEQGLREKKA